LYLAETTAAPEVVLKTLDATFGSVIEPTGFSLAAVAAVFVSTEADAVSTSDKRGSAVEVAGPDTREAVTDIESSTAPPRNESVTVAEVAVAVSPVVCAAVAAESVSESELITALEGATDITPKPNAATVTSA